MLATDVIYEIELPIEGSVVVFFVSGGVYLVILVLCGNVPPLISQLVVTV